MRSQWEDDRYEPESGSSPDTESTGTLILHFQPPELWETHVYCLNHPVYGILIRAPWKQSETEGELPLSYKKQTPTYRSSA